MFLTGLRAITRVSTMTELLKKITIDRDEAPSLTFKGMKIAEARTSANRAHEDWSGSPGRSSKFALFRTEAGSFVCQRIEYTQWQGEHDCYQAAVCKSDAEVVEFFGHGRLAKRIYDEAGIRFETEVA